MQPGFIRESMSDVSFLLPSPKLCFHSWLSIFLQELIYRFRPQTKEELIRFVRSERHHGVSTFMFSLLNAKL